MVLLSIKVLPVRDRSGWHLEATRTVRSDHAAAGVEIKAGQPQHPLALVLTPHEMQRSLQIVGRHDLIVVQGDDDLGTEGVGEQ